ncbi:MAG: hypothetical protein IKP39_03110 [Paludibacteraceae bacterium]|nr:hypothetical protein [Paludibacteraceae bacterium]
MKKLFLLIIVSVATLNGFAQSSGFDKLDEWTKVWKEGQQTYFGYPVNQQSALQEFYEWYVSTGMDRVNLNNAGDPMGRMIPEELEAALDTTRPALMVYAMGSTFKGAIDDMKALNEVLARHPNMAVYRHVDAALFGGYLPHVVVMQHVTKEKINGFIRELKGEN